MGSSKPTMRKIAKVAQVSPTTVWMVLHSKPGIPAETAQRVWAAAAELGYRAKPSANGAYDRSVGLLIEQYSVPVISDVFYGEIIRGFQTEAERLGYNVVLTMFDRAKGNLDVLMRGFAQKVSGFVVANDGDITSDMVIDMEGLSIPIVLVENHIDELRLPCILGDNFMAGYQITRHLLGLGHRKIALLQGPPKYSSLADRFRGCLAALGEAGLLIPNEWLPKPVSGHPLKGYIQMKEVLEQEARPTAVIAISDKTAFGAMEAIREAGLKIPHDIAIASIDNTLESAYSRPTLTTVNIPKHEMGRLALQKLDRLIQGEDRIPVKTIVYSELIVRESCGANLARRVDESSPARLE
ncbi:MAG: LacI family DNA-binding transcriptional regulator [Anaerolineae bacterium]|nr:LacI family DNA-binding transcriptional regulator [Anaerolineae bacterium]